MSDKRLEELYVRIDYTNYKGNRSWRTISPDTIAYSSNKWHPERQWLLRAWDSEKKAMREFAMKDIHEWCILAHN